MSKARSFELGAFYLNLLKRFTMRVGISEISIRIFIDDESLKSATTWRLLVVDDCPF
jgi:hypothetical protein